MIFTTSLRRGRDASLVGSFAIVLSVVLLGAEVCSTVSARGWVTIFVGTDWLLTEWNPSEDMRVYCMVLKKNSRDDERGRKFPPTVNIKKRGFVPLISQDKEIWTSNSKGYIGHARFFFCHPLPWQ